MRTLLRLARAIAGRIRRPARGTGGLEDLLEVGQKRAERLGRVLSLDDDLGKCVPEDLAVGAALIAEANGEQRRQRIAGAGLGSDGPGDRSPGSSAEITGKNETALSVVDCVSAESKCLISSLAPSGLAAVVGMPRPATTGMNALPSGPDGTGKATNASGSDSSASMRRAT